MIKRIVVAGSRNYNNYEEAKKYINEEKQFFSISDNKDFDNCEIFLLPDNCYFNGIQNHIPLVPFISPFHLNNQLILYFVLLNR